MKELIEKFELKGLPCSEFNMLLWRNDYRIFIFDPTPQGKVMNEYYLENNKIALENALIELNYMV
jgi:hypothetical protein